MSTLERAIALATAAHAGQMDKAGAPYILHPLRVMSRVRGETRRIVAVLHDVVEDTPITLEQLRRLGFADEVLVAVDALTKRPSEDGDEAYFDFVERAGRNAIAREVKMADIEDNLDLTRIAAPTERDRARIGRYLRARKLLGVIAREHGDREWRAPTILPLRGGYDPAAILRECPGDRPVWVCDFHVKGAEQAAAARDGTARPPRIGHRILNIDHHARLRCMERRVTSTQLAFEHLTTAVADGPAPWVVINHTDCDSVLSSAMALGYIERHRRYVDASICADHTGETNAIADLLQALDEARSARRGGADGGREECRTDDEFLESLRNLWLLERGEPLEPAAGLALELREHRRAKAERLVREGRVAVDEQGIALGCLDEEIDGAFFVPLLPAATLIVLACPHHLVPDHRTVKVRLGLAAPEGFSLERLPIREWDAAYGGRWNAGSNKRNGGTSVPCRDWVTRLRAHLPNGAAVASPRDVSAFPRAE